MKRLAPRVGNGCGLEGVAEVVDLQHQRVLHPRVVRPALVVERQRFVGVGEEDGMSVPLPSDPRLLALQQADVVGALGDRVRVDALRGVILGVDLLPQGVPAKRACRLAFLGDGEARREPRLHQARRLGIALVVLARERVLQPLALEPRAGVEPRPRAHGRHEQIAVDLARHVGEEALADAATDGLGVPLLDVGEAPVLALDGVVVAVVVAVAGDELGLGDVVVVLDALEHVDREREPRDPRAPLGLVLQVELRRRGVGEAGLTTQAVGEARQQVRLLPAHQVDVAERPLTVRREARRPDQTRRPGPEEVDDVDRGRRVRQRQVERDGLRQAVARLVEVEADAVVPEVDEVGGARAVEVGEAHAARIELIPRVEPRAPAPS